VIFLVFHVYDYLLLLVLFKRIQSSVDPIPAYSSKSREALSESLPTCVLHVAYCILHVSLFLFFLQYLKCHFFSLFKEQDPSARQNNNMMIFYCDRIYNDHSTTTTVRCHPESNENHRHVLLGSARISLSPRPRRAFTSGTQRSQATILLALPLLLLRRRVYSTLGGWLSHLFALVLLLLVEKLWIDYLLVYRNTRSFLHTYIYIFSLLLFTNHQTFPSQLHPLPYSRHSSPLAEAPNHVL